MFNDTITDMNIRNDGPNRPEQLLEMNGENIQFNRVSSLFSRNVNLIDNTSVDSTERVIGEGVPIATNELTFPSSTRILSIASTSGNDTSGGSGMISVLIIGLDNNFLVQVELVNLNGQTEVDTINQFSRINEMIIRDSGSSNKNEGIIYVSDNTDTFVLGVPQNRVYDIMDIGHGLSKTGLFTVPLNRDILIKKIIINTDASPTKQATIKFYRTNKRLGFPNSEILIETIYLAEALEDNVELSRILNETEDVRITAQSGGGGNVSIAIKLHTIIKIIR